MWWNPFRPAVAPHVEFLLSSERAGDLAALHATAFARAWEPHEFERMLCERSHVAHVLKAGTTLVGVVLSRQVLDEAEILTVVLAPAQRGAGLARSLLGPHLRALADLGTRTVHLEVEDGNAPALALYRRLGFQETGRRVGYYARPDGTRATALTMRTMLE